jgi:hypothetical protein
MTAGVSHDDPDPGVPAATLIKDELGGTHGGERSGGGSTEVPRLERSEQLRGDLTGCGSAGTRRRPRSS